MDKEGKEGREMEETKNQTANWRLIVLPLMFLTLAGLLSAGAAFAQFPGAGNSGSLPAQGKGPLQGTPTPTATCSPLGAWSIVPSPNPGTGGYFDGVAAISANDVWAVGWSGEGGGFHSLTEHWNGSIWSIVPNSSTAVLQGVAAISSNDVWAVGGNSNSGGTTTLHWDGSAWSVVPSPSPSLSYLYGVTAISSNDVWAVGYASNANLTLHWDGSTWSIVPCPNQGQSRNSLQAVSAASSNDVWAVGYYWSFATIRYYLTVHWDGTQWTVVSNPNTGGTLYGVAAMSANDAWAVGTGDTMHWNGSSWSQVPNPAGGILWAATAISSNDVWAVGSIGSGSSTPVAIHWNGSAWISVPVPSPNGIYNSLYGVAAVSSNDVWAVGWDDDAESSYHTLTEHYIRSSCATVTGTPPMSTPTRTATRTATVNTSATATPTCSPSGGWGVVSSPNFGAAPSLLRRVAAVSANDMWAVGGYNFGHGALIEHWNGTNWNVVSSPFADGTLYGVAAISANDVWAVGGYYNGFASLTEHWNGSSWSIVPSPSPVGCVTLYAVAGFSSNDVWAVGIYDCHTGYALALHWNGSSWSVVPTPVPTPYAYPVRFYAMAAISSNDIWAVGYYWPTAFQEQPLAMHWDGSAWSVVPTPKTGGRLTGASAISTNDVWAVGTAGTLHWDGTSWNAVANPSSGVLRDVVGVSSDDVWAVGDYGSGSSLPQAIHWDGSSWSVVLVPSTADPYNNLYGVAAISSNDVWAVGSHTDSGGFDNTLTEHYRAGPCVTPTGTPPTSTSTRTPTRTRTATPTPTITSTPNPCASAWNIVSSPNQGTISNYLLGVAVVSASDIWAVGYYGDFNYSDRTLTEHWDGSTWSIVASPNQGTNDNELRGVVAISSNDVWAIGYHDYYQTLTEHWDGTAWSIVPSPNQASDYNVLDSVSAVSSNDMWAVGEYVANNTYQTLTEHWNGTAWSIISSPNQGTVDNYLYSVAMVSANDVWAVGYYGDLQNGRRTLIDHWNGSAWSIISSPNQGTLDNYLEGVAVVSANDVWAVGYYLAGGVFHTFMEHWDGSAWSIVSSPSQPGSNNYLYSVAVVSASDVWAVGYYDNGPYLTLTEHWDGSAWSIVASPNLPPVDVNYLFGVAAVASNDAWVVGAYWNGNAYRTETQHLSSGCATQTPVLTGTPTHTPTSTTTAVVTATINAINSPTRTNSPTFSLSTSTPTAPTLATYTPTPTSPTSSTSTPAPPSPTSCPIEFSDVPNGSPFYPYIRCLACRGIVSGYSDGTFRPGNDITRGQLSKIVSSAAGFSEPETVQMFEDQPVGSTFYTYTARLASRGYVGGYACGGPGEPCVPPSNLPYFRTYNNATRGQITKIVSNAAGFTDPPAGQAFEDVPPGSTFYAYTERLASRDIMQGYACNGAPDEPCVPPDNLNYFRPFNNATRGQTSKIVANTFFPDCQTPAR